MSDSVLIENAIYDLCVEANTTLNGDVLAKISDAYNSETNEDAKLALGLILKNAQMAYEKKMPLCQDTGQVLIFVKIGRESQFAGKSQENIKEAINRGVARAYEENFYRKSVVKNALFDRYNTRTNTPCVIYQEIVDGSDIEFELLVKGAGSENVSVVEMLSPTATEDEIIDFVVSTVKKAGAKACPPYFLGVGIGGTIEYAGLLSKKALLLEENIDKLHSDLAEKIKDAVNELEIGAAGLGGAATALDVKVLTDFTHIACMPVAVTINCHSSRHAKCVIAENGTLKMQRCQDAKICSFETLNKIDFSDFIKVDTSEVEKLKSLKQGDKILLSGTIYTARDMAHKRLVEMLEKNEKLPFDLKNSIIFYAGPCPSSPECVVGSIGPTTSSRMDKFAPKLYENGVLATIGKGERNANVEKAIKKSNGLYFTIIGGIACYLSEKFIEKELIAFEDLGAEAIYRFKVKDLPLRLALS